MKNIIVALVALTLAIPLTAAADETGGGTGKNLALLNTTGCDDAIKNDNVYERIAALQKELAKKPATYTNDEVRQLEAKVDACRTVLNTFGF
ncbi:hypothetical protein FO488_04565 [Geobacter sp. FeAm09]|uniref:hypothetical protein n=1 Tax=Geobacter sp. FeAm09 TaxID=2597769 RepID=UPI0011F00A57|nr:hypothetical protein [Geobacter sp. FeAm09]QEM67488.1 hypothetical protein FO488_04565 [Geobacter sp. FeAm09]